MKVMKRLEVYPIMLTTRAKKKRYVMLMTEGENCAKQPLCPTCTEKGKVLSMALVEALSKPPDGKEGPSTRCGLQECLKELDKEK